jgi:hypothetical protein
MPFKSKAQRRKFAQVLVEGEITPDVYEEWNRETGGAHLPERVTKRKKATRRKPAAGRKKKAAASRARSRRTKATTSRKRSRGR